MTEAARKLPVDLEVFRVGAFEGTKYDFSEPFVLDGWEYYTDARVCVRVPAHASNTPVIDKPFPDVGKLPWMARRARTFVDWPAADYRIVPRVIEGDGELGEPDRVELYPDRLWIVIDGQPFSTFYHALISHLPNVHYATGTQPGKPLFFAFDGGEGMLMPCRATAEQIAADAAGTLTTPPDDDFSGGVDDDED